MRRLISTILAILTSCAIATGGAGYYVWASFTQPGNSSAEKTVVIPKGAGVSGIAALLHREGIIERPLLFRLGVELWARGRHLQAGEYVFPARVSPRAAMQIMVEGKSIQHFVTLAEGLTVAEIFDVLSNEPLLEGALPPPPPEGSLLPETYAFLRGESRATIVERMRLAMDRTLDELWAARDPAISIESKEQALTLASIVEKETGVAAERPHVASVFYNRLRKGMKLQSDPTVIYALTQGRQKLGRPLTSDDLKIDSPYNTYAVVGLPPGPIANPGRASLESTLRPLATEDLYFVADGTGGHVFAKTYKEHQKNVANWRKIQAQQSGN